jgi:hypothetical protein
MGQSATILPLIAAVQPDFNACGDARQRRLHHPAWNLRDFPTATALYLIQTLSMNLRLAKAIFGAGVARAIQAPGLCQERLTDFNTARIAT